MAANKQSGVNAGGWTKWQIALIVGTPIALGLGYWYYRCNRNKLKRFDSNDSEAESKSSINLVNDEESEMPEAAGDPAQRAQSMKTKGNKLFKGGKFDEAIRCYSEAIEICPPEKTDDIATFYQNRAAAYEQLKNYNGVIEDCTKALELNCRYSKAINRRAKAYEVNRNLYPCLEDVTALCLLEGFQNHSSLLMADRILKQLGREKAQSAMTTRKPVLPSYSFIRSYFASFSNDPIMASIKNDDIVDTAELSGYLKAKQDLKRGSYNNIIEDCTLELSNLYSSKYRAEALLLRATFYMFTGQYNLACTDLEEVSEMENADKKIKVNALIKLGSMKMQEEKPDESLKIFQRVVELDPENCDIYHHRGQMNLIVEKMDEARDDFKKAVELAPDFPIAAVQKCYVECRYALIQQNLAGYQQALDTFEVLLRKFSSCVEGYALYGQALMDQGNFDKAEECFEKALELDPDNANVYVHKGLLYYHWKQDVNTAIRLINEAIKRDDRCELAYETLGTIQVQRGKLDQAVELFNQAIALAKTEAEMAHLYSLYDAAQAQAQAARRLGLQIPPPE